MAATNGASQVIQSYLQSFLNTLAFDVEHGTALPADRVREVLTSAAQDNCNNFPAGCPGGLPTDEIDAAVATYSAALTAQVGTATAYVAAGQVASPYTPQAIAAAAGLYYSPSSGPAAPSNVIAPEMSPTSPAFTNPTNVAATAPSTPISGTAGGVGPSQGGSMTLQSSLIPHPKAGPVVASLAPNNSKLLLILAAVFIVALLVGRSRN